MFPNSRNQNEGTKTGMRLQKPVLLDPPKKDFLACRTIQILGEEWKKTHKHARKTAKQKKQGKRRKNRDWKVRAETKKPYTTTTERQSFGELFWPQRKAFQAGVVDTKPLLKPGIYHRNLSSRARVRGLCGSKLPRGKKLPLLAHWEWRGVLAKFFWSLFPTKQSTQTPQKIRGRFGAKFGQNSGRKFEQIRGTFVLQLF